MAATVDAPLVSVLVPAFDAETTIGPCLRSIERQRERRWECVVVDDGSRDATRDVALGFARRDSRFVVVAGEHRGLVPTLRRGLDVCRGRYVARMDADDLMHRDRLGAQVRALETHSDWAGAGCHVRLFPRASLRDGRRGYEAWLNAIDSPARVRTEAFVECPVAHPTLVMRREIFDRFGYRDTGWAEDYDLVLRVLAAGEEIGMVARRLVAWRDLPMRLSRTGDAYSLARFTACKAAFLSNDFLARGDAYVLCGYGATGKAMRRALERHGKQARLVVDVHPGRVGRSLRGVPVIHPRDLSRPAPGPILVSVAGAERRQEVRRELARRDFVELRDYVCVA